MRIPIHGLDTTYDHFIPGLGVDPNTSGATAHLTMTYYYYPEANCGNACKLYVGFTTSQDGGKTWLQQTSGTRNSLNDVFFIDSRTGWASGDETLLVTGTGGR